MFAGSSYAAPINNIENGSDPGDGPLAASAAATVTAERHWLAGLVRPDVLALTGIIATAAALFGFPVLDLTLSAAFLQRGSEAWRHGPVLVATGIAVVAGLFALRQAALNGSSGWVKALAGTAG